jgi:glycerate-2-kinase
MKEIGERTIKNFDVLAITPARSTLLTLAEAGFQAIQTPEVIRTAVSLSGTTLTIQGTSYDLEEYEHLYVLGVGKCAVDAAVELEAILGNRITDGVIIDVRPGEGLKHIRPLVGTHPYPSTDNSNHTKQLLTLAEKAGPHDLVLAIISGGGSTLLSQPKTHTPAEEAALVKHLFKKGATIEELNTVRKHLSQARGGYLASATYPATLVTLIFSDVPGDDLHTIASGPTILDLSTRGDAVRVLTKYDAEACGFSTDHLFDTPKDAELFRQVRNELVLTNKTALEAMAVCAKDLGYTVTIVDTRIQGEARDVAKKIVERLHKEKPRTVLLYGGETTVTIHGPGKGGRNEELAASALLYLHDGELLVSLASDGRDNTEYAGAIADHHTQQMASLRGLRPEDFIDTSDTFSLFRSLQQGIETGYTGANVADLVIALQHGVE